VLLGRVPEGRSMGDVLQDKAGELQTGQKGLYDWCRRHRHQPVKTQHAALSQRVRGHFNYFGSAATSQSAAARRSHEAGLVHMAVRRSQRTRLTWERFGDVLQQFPLPRPRITVRIWGG